MKTLVELAKEMKVKPSTLSVRLWDADIKCTKYGVENGKTLKLYDASAVKKVKNYLAENPVRKKAGRPLKSRR